eukprot:TRINITY_DN570_c0_g1_i1.p1 TRINITY_DN570_c0_g1~~TRINITY_DN570_c0_g1_i1.p1  ORF type:complete len:979 (-),score=306.89 TRINITY_DN570_c0_g1_i1:16-2952(-)
MSVDWEYLLANLRQLLQSIPKTATANVLPLIDALDCIFDELKSDEKIGNYVNQLIDLFEDVFNYPRETHWHLRQIILCSWCFMFPTLQYEGTLTPSIQNVVLSRMLGELEDPKWEVRDAAGQALGVFCSVSEKHAIMVLPRLMALKAKIKGKGWMLHEGYLMGVGYSLANIVSFTLDQGILGMGQVFVQDLLDYLVYDEDEGYAPLVISQSCLSLREIILAKDNDFSRALLSQLYPTVPVLLGNLDIRVREASSLLFTACFKQLIVMKQPVNSIFAPLLFCIMEGKYSEAHGAAITMDNIFKIENVVDVLKDQLERTLGLLAYKTTVNYAFEAVTENVYSSANGALCQAFTRGLIALKRAGKDISKHATDLSSVFNFCLNSSVSMITDFFLTSFRLAINNDITDLLICDQLDIDGDIDGKSIFLIKSFRLLYHNSLIIRDNSRRLFLSAFKCRNKDLDFALITFMKDHENLIQKYTLAALDTDAANEREALIGIFKTLSALKKSIPKEKLQEIFEFLNNSINESYHEITVCSALSSITESVEYYKTDLKNKPEEINEFFSILKQCLNSSSELIVLSCMDVILSLVSVKIDISLVILDILQLIDSPIGVIITKLIQLLMLMLVDGCLAKTIIIAIVKQNNTIDSAKGIKFAIELLWKINNIDENTEKLDTTDFCNDILNKTEDQISIEDLALIYVLKKHTKVLDLIKTKSFEANSRKICLYQQIFNSDTFSDLTACISEEIYDSADDFMESINEYAHEYPSISSYSQSWLEERCSVPSLSNHLPGYYRQVIANIANMMFQEDLEETFHSFAETDFTDEESEFMIQAIIDAFPLLENADAILCVHEIEKQVAWSSEVGAAAFEVLAHLNCQLVTPRFRDFISSNLKNLSVVSEKRKFGCKLAICCLIFAFELFGFSSEVLQAFIDVSIDSECSDVLMTSDLGLILLNSIIKKSDEIDHMMIQFPDPTPVGHIIETFAKSQ